MARRKLGRRTKIVCTLGPATSDPQKIKALVQAGMDVARLNFSHGTWEEHARVARWVREASEAVGRPVAILQDLAGPKIRTGRLRGGRAIPLQAGEKFRLTSEPMSGSARRVSITYPDLAQDVRKGDRILLDDGRIELRVLGVSGPEVETLVVYGGTLSEHKGVNLPGVKLSVASPTPKDEADLGFGAELGVDYIALSFVRKPGDVRRVKALLEKANASIPVLAKLEKPEAIEELDAILAVSDGVMVARGDLGVELPPEGVPLLQKEIIRKAGEARVSVITATQMLESMTTNPRPTRAEVSDVANAIFDGTDAVMLSAETAAGRYPLEAVQMMVRIAERADQRHQETFLRPRHLSAEIAETISESVVHAAYRLNIRAVAAFTRGGATARLISKHRPPCPVYAICHDARAARRAALYWGVTPFVMPLLPDRYATLARAEEELLRRKLVSRGDIVAFVAGIPGRSGQTNLLELVRAGS